VRRKEGRMPRREEKRNKERRGVENGSGGVR